jgi:ribosomal protein S18 acetylase RimI-like enzyme
VKPTVVRLEELALTAWPALQAIFYDGWIVRFAEGYTKRANSVVPLYPGSAKLDEKIGHCQELYTHHRLPTIFKLADTPVAADLDRRLELHNFVRVDNSSVQVRSLQELPQASADAIEIVRAFGENWFSGFFGCSRIGDPEKQRTIRTLLGLIPTEVVVVRKIVDDQTVGCGFGVVQNGFVGLFDIIVDEDFRGRGFATQVVTAILREASLLGARAAYLQVLASNAPALSLYRKLGFREQYRYYYRVG